MNINIKTILAILSILLATSCMNCLEEDLDIAPRQSEEVPLQESQSQQQMEPDNQVIEQKVSNEIVNPESGIKYVFVSENTQPLSTKEVSENPLPVTPQQVVEEVENSKLTDKVFFLYNSSAITKRTEVALKKQLGYLMDDKISKIKLEGNTDSRGSREYNLKLGKKRALAVKKLLVRKGINSSKINVISNGEDKPAVTGIGSKVWSQNRRVVITKE